MLDFITYDFGYSWSVRYAMIAPLIVAGSLAALAAWRSWPRWVFILATLMALWAAGAVVVLNVMLNSPMPLPTERFLRAGAGRVLDVGAGSGRAAVGVLIARPHVTATGVDIYSGYWGIDGNTPERFMANARIAEVADRAAARVGDMRQLPFGDGEFDAVVSSYAIDHLPWAERPKAIAEVARVLKPGGEFLLMIIRVDWRTWLVSPLLAHHPSQNPEPWRELLQQHGFSVEDEGTPFTTLYFLARKHRATRTHGSTTCNQNLTRAEPSNCTERVRVLPATRLERRRRPPLRSDSTSPPLGMVEARAALTDRRTDTDTSTHRPTRHGAALNSITLTTRHLDGDGRAGTPGAVGRLKFQSSGWSLARPPRSCVQN